MENFDDIRPFYDEEVNQAIRELFKEPEFATFLKYLFPNRSKEELFDEYIRFNSLFDFQSHFAYEAVKQIIEHSIDGLSFSGLEKLQKDMAYLFMSNHRDIVLDPGLMSYILFTNGFHIPQQAIGSNLLVSPMVTRLFRLNKSFVVQRNESPRQMYEAWKKLSAYIYHVITERKENIWIAQREGRAKDGDDRTQSGIIKMFLMNFNMEYVKVIRQLNIVPVCITYEFDPCDYFKALELYHASMNLPFKKDNDFNLNSMLTGLQGKKGRVHIAFGRPVSDMISEQLLHDNHKDWVQWLAATIDKEIHSNYHLWPTNYVACDLLLNSNIYSGRYTEQDRSKFLARLEHQLKKESDRKDELKKLILTNYANSVINQETALRNGD